MRYMIVLLLVAGCSNKYDECIEKEKESYRSTHPKASYGQIMSKQSEFEMMCSQYKGK